MPPSIEELEIRLRKRSTESEESLRKRMSKAKHELTFAFSFDKIIVNDDLEKAIKEAHGIVETFLK